MHISVHNPDLRVQVTETKTTIKLWLFFHFVIVIGDETKPISVTLLHDDNVAKSKSAIGAQAKMIALYEQLARYTKQRSSPADTAPYESWDFAKTWSETITGLRSVADKVRKHADLVDETRETCLDLARNMAIMRDLIVPRTHAMLETWVEHGILDFSADRMPIYGAFQRIDEWTHKIASDRLKRLHVSFMHTTIRNSEPYCRVTVVGRQASDRKKIEAPLHLLQTTFPKIIARRGNSWDFHGADGVAMSDGWKQHFYDDVTFRAIMRTTKVTL